jgi:outer membrane receptor protein involved in Fe transport
MVSGTFQFERGEGELTTVLVDSRTIKFNPGQAATQIVNVAKSAVIRPNVVQLDLSAEKSWKLTERQTLSGRINAYNALNNATLTNEVTQLGPTYHRPTAIQAGRMLKFGFNYEF